MRLAAVILTVACVWLAGCNDATTDTGYKPRRLGMNGTEIRSLYAPEFSPEAAAAAGDKKEGTLYRPSIGPGGSR